MTAKIISFFQLALGGKIKINQNMGLRNGYACCTLAFFTLYFQNNCRFYNKIFLHEGAIQIVVFVVL